MTTYEKEEIKNQMIELERMGFENMYEFDTIKVFASANNFNELSTCIDERLMQYIDCAYELEREQKFNKRAIAN